jgi:hypothetical protein
MKLSYLIAPLCSAAMAVAGRGNSTKYSRCPPNHIQPDGKLTGTSWGTAATIIISRQRPDEVCDPAAWPKTTPKDLCTIFNMQLVRNATYGKLCNLVFDFPDEVAAPKQFEFHGPGDFEFQGYKVGYGGQPWVSTWKNQPPLGPSPQPPRRKMVPGTSHVLSSMPCGLNKSAPEVVTVSGRMCSYNTAFRYKQGNLVCPLGFYVILTDIDEDGSGSESDDEKPKKHKDD